MAEIILTVFEIAFAIAGIYALVLALRGLKNYSMVATPEAAWKRSGIAALQCLGAAAAFTVTVFLGGRSLAALLLVLILPSVFAALAVFLAYRVGRRDKRSQVVAEDGSNLVVIRQVVAGRIRGSDDQGKPVVLTDAQREELVGSTGRVRLLAAKALPMAPPGAPVPFLGFWNDDGTSVLLYHDDEVQVVARSA